MIVALAQSAAHPPSWLALVSVLIVLIGCAILLLLPDNAWGMVGRIARGEDDLGAPFDLDDRRVITPETVSLSRASWEPEAGAFAAPPIEAPLVEDVIAPEIEAEPEAAPEPEVAAALEPEASAPAEPEAASPEIAAPEAVVEVQVERSPTPRVQEVILPSPTAAELLERRCKMDLAATRDGLELVVELPGLDEQDVDIQVNNDLLTISGELKFDPDWTDKTYRLMERDYGSFSRSIELPEGVRPDRIRAAMNRGILTVTIPNPTRPEPKRIEIEAPAAPMRLVETGYGLEVAVDMPGFEESDIEVAVSEGVLTVRGERRPACGEPGGEPLDAAAQPVFSRSIELPEGVNADYISAALAKGVLTVRIPNPVKPDARRIPVLAAA